MLFGKKSVEDIVRPITKIADELRIHAELSTADADRHTAEAQRRHDLAADAEMEARKASTHADKLTRLFA